MIPRGFCRRGEIRAPCFIICKVIIHLFYIKYKSEFSDISGERSDKRSKGFFALPDKYLEEVYCGNHSL